MPSTRIARHSGRTTTRAASVPVSRPENPQLESLRLKRQRSPILDDEGKSWPSSLSNVAITRGRTRTSSFGAADCTPSTSAAVTAPIAEVEQQRPRKRQKRASSTPASPQSSQVFVQLQARRRSRSRAGSPATDVEYVPPSRASARLARRIHSFLNGRNSDIYTHLAGPNGAGDLLSDPAGSVPSSTSNGTTGSQPVRKARGRRRKTVDLTDENVKKDLIEEWARMRQIQGTLSLPEVDERGQMSLRDARKDDQFLKPTAQTSSPDTHTAGTQRIVLEGPLSLRENALSAGKDENETNHLVSALPSERGTDQPLAPSAVMEAPAPLVHSPRVDNDPPNGDPDFAPEVTQPELSQPPTSPQTQSGSRLREYSAVTKLPISKLAVSPDGLPKDSHSHTLSTARSADKSNICLDLDQEFHMLDASEIFTLPWEPVTSQLYVPPSLGKLISGMREQLTIEARARRRAEDLYHAELSRRVSTEKTVEDLRVALERKDKLIHVEDRIETRHEDDSK